MTKVDTLWCERGKHHWHRESKRGRKPSSCPEHQPKPEVKVKTEEEREAERQVKAARLAENKAKGEREREEQQARQKREAQAQAHKEIKRLRSELPGLSKRYNRALDKAVRAREPDSMATAFDVADAAMTSVIQTSRRIKVLEEGMNV